MHKLKYIYLTKNDLRDSGIAALVKAIKKETMPKLRQLHLAQNRISDTGFHNIHSPPHKATTTAPSPKPDLGHWFT